MSKDELQARSYGIDELPHNIKRQIFKKFRTRYAEGLSWQNEILERWKVNIERQGFSDVDIKIYGVGKKGGACFTATAFDVRKFAESHKPFFSVILFPEITKYMTVIADNIHFHIMNFKVKRPKTNFYYSYTNACKYNDEPLNDHQQSVLDKKLFRIIGYLQSICRGIEGQIYSEISNEYARLTSDAYLETTMINNSVRFSLQGKWTDNKNIDPECITWLTNKENEKQGGKS